MITDKLYIYILSSVLIMTICAGCESDIDLSQDNNLPLIIEGWIEEGENPIVMVTRALDLTDETAGIEDAVEKWCRVSIWDNDRQYMLTAHKNDAYIPNYVYTSSRLRGIQGHTYRLVVETEDTIATSESTLLPCGSISRLEHQLKDTVKEKTYSIRAYLNNLSPYTHYKIFCKGAGERRHYPSFSSNITYADYNEETGQTVTRGTHSAFTDDKEYSEYFKAGERVEVKLCSMEPAIYTFWKEYDRNVALSDNIFFTFSSDCTGNIMGAKGYWAAYGTSIASIILPKD